ncbi:MAG: DUF5615 family PIN-like protein [Candidatus Eisenbacteria bacterium]|nr:DUF5615 family PIN-like protein [Candidatus Eisenbacteria bacterium]
MDAPRFLADDMLARLARWLRGAGLDVAYAGDGAADDRILKRARREGRLVLTRDGAFPGDARERIVLESAVLDDQLVELFRRFPAYDPLARPFTRCMECNGAVRVEGDPPDRPSGVEGPFTRCESCGRLFWEGSHVERIRERLGRARRRTEEALEEERRGEPPPFERVEYDRFFREALPLLGFSRRGYRRVRKGLRTRLRRRLRELSMRDLECYLSKLREDREERDRLGAILRITISRFFRDRHVWLRFPETLFPVLADLAEGGGPARIWSLGSASGEEPFTLRMVWNESSRPDPPPEILASDISRGCLARSREGLYGESALHNAPVFFREKYFNQEGNAFRLDRAVIESVRFERFDWRRDGWPAGFHWVLARNGPFTYLDDAGRVRAERLLAESIVPGGFLWIGGNERLPGRDGRWERIAPNLYRRTRRGGEVSEENAGAAGRKR